jgi:hypothetical protein
MGIRENEGNLRVKPSYGQPLVLIALVHARRQVCIRQIPVPLFLQCQARRRAEHRRGLQVLRARRMHRGTVQEDVSLDAGRQDVRQIRVEERRVHNGLVTCRIKLIGDVLVRE